MYSAPTVSHQQLAVANLIGHKVPMDGRMFLAGRVKRLDDKLGVIHEPSPEAEAHERWQDREFLEIERRFAKNWREALHAVDLRTVAAGVRAFGINPGNCRSLEEAKALAQTLLAQLKVADLVKLTLAVLNVSNRAIEKLAVQNWKRSGRATLAEYAPYAAHILLVEVFFQVALGAEKIGTRLKSTRTDIVYLYYVPFCQVFVSGDRLHEKCAPLFLRESRRQRRHFSPRSPRTLLGTTNG